MADDYTDYTGRHAHAGDVTHGRAAGHMARLGDLHDFEVAEGYPDIRGWKVVTADGVHVGKVRDLIVDTAAMRTRYIDLVLDDGVRKGEVADRDGHRRVDDREVLLPIDAAQLDDRGDVVRVAGMSVDQIVALPLYDEEALRTGTIQATYRPRGRMADERVVDDWRANDRMATDQEVRRPAVTERTDRAERDDLGGRVAGAPLDAEETVIERHPVVWEEIVVRRRVADTGGAIDATRERADLGRSVGGTHDDRRDDLRDAARDVRRDVRDDVRDVRDDRRPL